jgi:hypothetical protein
MGRPRGIAVLPDGRIAATDYVHHVIQLVDPKTGAVTPLAGTWDQKGYADGAGAVAKFSMPYGIAVVNGALIVADFENHRLRKVGLDGTVSTFAGSGTAGFADGDLASAKLNKPQGLAAAANGDLYVTDTENFRVRRIHAGKIATIAGSGQAGYVDNDDRLRGAVLRARGAVREARRLDGVRRRRHPRRGRALPPDPQHQDELVARRRSSDGLGPSTLPRAWKYLHSSELLRRGTSGVRPPARDEARAESRRRSAGELPQWHACPAPSFESRRATCDRAAQLE